MPGMETVNGCCPKFICTVSYCKSTKKLMLDWRKFTQNPISINFLFTSIQLVSTLVGIVTISLAAEGIAV
jgi:hypothetical protein